MKYDIAVIDLGKTNKKIAVFSSDLKFISKEAVNIGEKKIGGVLCDNIPEVLEWVKAKLKKISAKHDIKVISSTTFGATIACIGKKGGLVMPVVSYMQDPLPATRRKFFDIFGGEEKLYLETATPPFGNLLCAGMHVFWLKEERPKDFAKIKKILFLPNYIGYYFTGNCSNEPTSFGCHSYLYNFKERSFSRVADRTGFAKLSEAELSSSWNVLGKIKPDISREAGLDPGCRVTMGMHDSNSSLLPYLLSMKKDFLLASTGTWGVFMFSSQDKNSFYLSPADMHKDTLYFLDAFARPLRSSRFALGMEHDHYSSIIERKFKTEPRNIKPNLNLIKKLIDSRSCFVIPAILKGSGQFPDSRPGIINEGVFYKDAGTAYTALNISLAIQSYFAIRQAFGKRSGENIPIHIEGGFRNNHIYMGILSTLFPEQKVVATDITEATSLGAAICGKCAVEGIEPESIDPALIKIKERPVEKLDISQDSLREYIAEFEKHCNS